MRLLLSISLLLLVLTLAACVRTFCVNDVLSRVDRHGEYEELATLPMQLRISFVRGWPAGIHPNGVWYSAGDRGRVPIFGQHYVQHWYPVGIGIGIRESLMLVSPGGAAVRVRTFAIPLPLPLLLLAAYPAWCAWSRRRNRLRGAQWIRAGRCAACGYDLRGSPGSGRCPECGREAPNAPKLTAVAS